MKRLHVHVSVEDFARSVRFYSTLFAAEPTVMKPDYAKWLLDDPRVNFAISRRTAAVGIEHLGIQVETRDELQEVAGRLQQAEPPRAGGRSYHLLLRPVGKGMDHGPAWGRLGDIPDERRKPGLRPGACSDLSWVLLHPGTAAERVLPPKA